MLSCPDRVGVVAAVTGLLAQYNGWIIDANQHADSLTNTFFMRVEIKKDSLQENYEKFAQQFSQLALQFTMQWSLTDSSQKQTVIILVSKQGHCLSDLLYRYASNELNFNLHCVISNHTDNRELVDAYHIPYHYLPINENNKQEVFQQIENIFLTAQVDIVVLARFMQIFPQELCQRFAGKIINIHHGFLPSFVGANSYGQAFNRGVKLVGATCHYVTEDLDEGPIIEQDVVRINHKNSVEDLKRMGQDIEKIVLAHGLRYILENRVIIHNNKTIILD
jgi:formyltetrahydrofolate deformylase